MTLEDIVFPAHRLVMIVGSYGSGKTEVAVNLALQLAERGTNVQIADLDIVNPYFRCREAKALMEHHGVRVVVPPGAQAHADLPIILPEIAGMLHPPPHTVSIFDVGGDDVGARALASLRPALADGPYELLLVLNSRRPFTSDLSGSLKMLRAIEDASRFAVTGLLVNSHLMEETTPSHIIEGWELAKELSLEAGIPIRCVAALGQLAAAPELDGIDVPIMKLNRHMLPPWGAWPGFEASVDGDFEPRSEPWATS